MNQGNMYVWTQPQPADELEDKVYIYHKDGTRTEQEAQRQEKMQRETWKEKNPELYGALKNDRDS